MESITDHIRNTSRTMSAPPELKSRIMQHVTNIELMRDTSSEAMHTTQSYHYKKSPFNKRAFWMLSGAVVASVLFVVQATTLSTTTTLLPLTVADEIVAEYQNNSDSTSNSQDTLQYIDSLQAIQNLVYVDSE